MKPLELLLSALNGNTVLRVKAETQVAFCFLGPGPTFVWLKIGRHHTQKIDWIQWFYRDVLTGIRGK